MEAVASLKQVNHVPLEGRKMTNSNESYNNKM